MHENKLPPIHEIDVILYPELIAAALKMNEIDLYVFWSILKAVDRRIQGSSKISISSMLTVINNVFNTAASQSYNKIKKGTGVYWNKPGKSSSGERVTTLLGKQAVIDHLQPTSTYSEPFVFKCEALMQDIQKSTKELKGLMIAAVASRYVCGRPFSLRSICELTGQSKSTVQRALRECNSLNIITNCQPISTHKTIDEAKYKLARMAKQDSRMAYRIATELDGFTIYRQMPNSYSLVRTKRLPLRKRPKELKRKDVENTKNLKLQKYYHEETKKPITHEHLKLCGVKSFPSVTAYIWESNTKAELVVLKKSTTGKWEDIKIIHAATTKINDNNTNNVSV
jgi:hypothetical protein